MSEPMPSEPADHCAGECPVTRQRDNERQDRHRAEVPRPVDEERVVSDARDQPEHRGAPRRLISPRPQQRYQRDENEGLPPDRGAGEGEEDAGGDRGDQAQSMQIFVLESTSWWIGFTK